MRCGIENEMSAARKVEEMLCGILDREGTSIAIAIDVRKRQ